MRVQELFCGIATVVFLHGAAVAQKPEPPSAPPPAATPYTSEAPPPSAAPAPVPQPPSDPTPPAAPPYPLPPGYEPPPVYYPPVYYPPPFPRRTRFRPFTLGGGLGVGVLSFLDAREVRRGEPGISYTLRFGFGVNPRWIVFLGLEGTTARTRDVGIWQTAYLVGTQVFPLERFYLRGGLGIASSESDDLFLVSRGQAFMLAAGFEFAQGYNTSLALEISGTLVRYTGETWSQSGLNFVISFF